MLFLKRLRFLLILLLTFLPFYSLFSPTLASADVEQKPLAQVRYSLTNRASDSWVNEVFTDNILLTVNYIGARIDPKKPIVWDEIRKPTTISFTLKPGETFAFHDSFLAEYQNKNVVTTKAHFVANEGFRSDGWLMGDGVCHLASFMAKVAKDAKLIVVAPTSHEFMQIPDIDPVDGVSIYSAPNNYATSARQNLYITNSYNKEVVFVFEYTTENLRIKIIEEI